MTVPGLSPPHAQRLAESRSGAQGPRKLPVGDVLAKAAMSLKKLSGLSLGENKQRAANDEHVLSCPYGDLDGIALINKARKEMESHGVHVRLHRNGLEETAECFDNVEGRYRETERLNYPD